MDEQPLITRWSDAEAWLEGEARECTAHRSLPASVAFAFHDGHVSAVIETPTFSVEDADLITDELCRFLPQLHADQLLVVWPATAGMEPDGMPSLWLLKAHLGDRSTGWRTLLYPLPFDRADIPIAPVEVECDDPWSARIHGIFDMPVPPIHRAALVTPHDDRFMVAVHPDGPYAEITPLFSFN